MPDPETLLIHGRAVLTGRLDRPEIEDGAVAVRGPLIEDVGEYAELRGRFPKARELGGADRFVLPGLVSAHQHGGGATSVQLGVSDQPFERWLIEMLGIPPLDVRMDTRYHALRLIENGITTTLHSHYVRDPTRYEAEVEDVLAGYADAGVRVAFAPHYIDRNFLTYGEDDAFLASLPLELRSVAEDFARPAIEGDAYLDLVERLSTSATAADPLRRRILFGPVAPQWCSPAMLARIGRRVRDGERGAHLHLLESAAQRAYLDASLERSVVEWLDELGLLGPSSSVAHGVWLNPDEIALLAARGATLVLNAGCNLRLGNGIAPLAGLFASGIDLAIGTDDMTLGDDDDLFAELRLIAALARTQGAWIDPAVLLRAATYGGARAAGFGNVVGSLEPGKRADVVLLDAARILEPIATGARTFANALELTLARVRAADVRSVVLDGEEVYREGVHRGVERGVDRGQVAAAVAASALSQTATAGFRERARTIERLAAARASWSTRAAGGASEAGETRGRILDA